MKPGEIVMTITVTLMEETDDDVDLSSVLFINAQCDPGTYAPAFAKICREFEEKFNKALKRYTAPTN